MNRIYLDYNATTPLCAEAREAMIQYLDRIYGNPSSLHWAGQQARKGLDQARAEVAKLFGVSHETIFFTSGGTEAANLAIHGILLAMGDATGGGPGRVTRWQIPHIVASSVEHHSVLEPLQSLQSRGEIEIDWIPVDSLGGIDPEEIAKKIRPETVLVAMMFANNETGNIYPVNAVGEIARKHEVPFFSDGVQVAGKLPINLEKLPIDLFSFSAHKFGGPKGVGGLYIRKGLKISPLIEGGGQEGKRRGGTENVAGIIGLAAALKKSYSDCEREVRALASLRNRLQEAVLDIPGSRLHGDPDHRLANTLNVGFQGIDSEILLILLDQEGIAASNGAACSSGTLEPSHVLIAQGLSTKEARGAVRFSLGRETTNEEIETVSRVLPGIVDRLRSSQ